MSAQDAGSDDIGLDCAARRRGQFRIGYSLMCGKFSCLLQLFYLLQ